MFLLTLPRRGFKVPWHLTGWVSGRHVLIIRNAKLLVRALGRALGLHP